MSNQKLSSTQKFDGQHASIGRVVHYMNAGEVWPATISGLFDDDTVRLFVMADSGHTLERVRYEPGPPHGPHNTWHWPPRV